MTPIAIAYTDWLLKAVFSFDDQRHNNQLGSFIERNTALGNPAHGFLFGGKFWSFYPKKSQIALSKRVLHPNLQAEMTAYMAEVAAVEKDRYHLKQRLTQLLRDCVDSQEIRDALPESALQFLPDDLKNLSRIQSEGWPLKNKAILMSDFVNTTQMFLFYSANRMLY